jgi:hypothetical protein
MAIPKLILDATMLASRLGLPPERFMAARRRGPIRQAIELGMARMTIGSA